MEGQRVAQLKRLLRNKNINVARIEVAAHDRKADTVYVFFEYAAEVAQEDKETLKRLKETAAEVSKDTVYAKLKNVKQRELFLLDHYDLPKRDSADVVELIKIVEIEAEIAEGKTEEIRKEKEI
jgi:hypothetical protein